MKSSVCVVVMCLALSLTSGAVFSAGEQAHGHHDFPPAVLVFHDVMAPLWHSAPGEGRARQTCQQYQNLFVRSQEIIEAPAPANVNARHWFAAARALQQSVEGIGNACQRNISPEPALAQMHHEFHELVRQVGHRH